MKITPNAPNSRNSVQNRGETGASKGVKKTDAVQSVTTDLSAPAALTSTHNQDIDTERVEAIRSAIEQGEFSVSTPEVAEQLLQSVQSFLEK